VFLLWTPVPQATRYSITRGEIQSLRQSGGNYATSVNFCLADQGGFASDNQIPHAGDGYWYLQRAVNCNVPGTYDEGVASQSGLRDAEIAAGSPVCP